MSTIKVNKIENTTTTAGGVAIDSSGHVQVDGVQMPSAGPLSNRNLIINGAMNVAQRGTSSTTSGFATVDRFRTSYAGGVVTQSQESLTSSDSPYSLGFRKFYRLQNTTASADPTPAGHNKRFLIRLEAQDIANSGWDYTSSSSYITLSMWVRSSVGQTFTWYAHTIDGTEQSYTWDVTLTANTWTKITKSFPGNSNITIDNDNGLGLMFDCGMYWGTQYTDASKTNDEWSAYSGTARTKPFDNTWTITTNATFDVTGVQLEVGEKATPFEHRSYGDEFARCQRYYIEYNYGSSSGQPIAAHYGASVGANSWMYAYGYFPAVMRADPSFKISDTSGNEEKLTIYTSGGGAGTSNVTPYTVGASTHGFNFSDYFNAKYGIVIRGYKADAEL